jgi:hypothetical protein
MPNSTVRAAAEGLPSNLPGDNSDPRMRFLGDVGDLAKMVGVFFGEIERAFCPTRGRPGKVQGVRDFSFSDDWADRIMFLAGEVYDRSRSLALRAQAMEDEAAGDAVARQPGAPAADSFEVLSDLEGAISMIDAYRAAVSELAGTAGNAPRRLVGINAICGPLGDEVDWAIACTETVRKLYEKSERAQEGCAA